MPQNSEFDWPWEIVFRGADIIVPEQSENSRVQDLRRHGEYHSHFGGNRSLDQQLNDPAGLFINSNGSIIVADSRVNKLIINKIFSADRQLLDKLGTEGSIFHRTLSLYPTRRLSYSIRQGWSFYKIQ